MIPSEIGAGRAVETEVLGQLEEHGWSERDVFGIRLAFEESVVNAMKHGNVLDPEKRVRIRCRLADDLMRIEVTDEGPGFDPDAVPDPTHDDHREKASGRGVLLMRRFMDRVEFSEKGNAVLLEKRRSAEGD
jgi:serine/threonine-protein kinase RsbW